MIQFLIHAFEGFKNAIGSADHYSIHANKHILFREVHIVIISVIALFIFMSPLLIFGENSHIFYHDNLDSGIVWYKVLAESGQIFGASSAIIPNIMGGLPRFAYPSEFSVIVWLFYFFKPFTAYMINQFMLHTIAFLGMYLLLKHHFLNTNDQNSILIRVGVSLTFAFMPFLPLFGHSIATLPLALWAFLNIRKNDVGWKNWAVIMLITLYSSLIYSYLFFLFLLSLLWVRDFVNYKEINHKFLFSIVLMILIFVLVEYRLFYTQFFNNNFVSHRVGWNLYKDITVIGSIKEMVSIFLFGEGHTKSHHTFVILPITLLGIWILIKDILKRKLGMTAFFKSNSIIIILILTVIISFIFGFRGYFDRMKIIPLQLRFYWLLPLMWYIVFALSLHTVIRNIKLGRMIVVIALSLQVLVLFYNTDWIRGVLKESYGKLNKSYIVSPSYRGFFSEKIFNEIYNHIGKGKNSYRVVSIGIHPSIAIYNGFYTLDGYMVNYPLEYKHKFRKIIEKELEKNKIFRDYYDDWGNRVYIFIDDIEKKRDDPRWDWFMIRKPTNFKINNLELNIDIFKEMGGEFIISAAEIVNCREKGLSFDKVFDDKALPWKIYLYRVQNS